MTLNREQIARIILGPKSHWNYGDLLEDKLQDWLQYPEVARALAKADAILVGASWRPIDTAPRDGTVIIVGGRYPNGAGYVDQCFWAHEHWWGRKTDPPTHWMPLPEPPEPA